MSGKRVVPLHKQGRFKIIRRKDTGTLQIIGTFEGRLYRFKAGEDLREAKQRLANFIFELDSGWRAGAQRTDTWQAVVQRIRHRHMSSAKDRGLPFLITAAEIYGLMKEADFRCSVSGIAFSKHEIGVRALVDPWSPSLDRIDNRQGYHRDNVRIVCVAANIAMNAWGYDVMLRLARGVIRNSLATIPEPDSAETDTAIRLVAVND